MNIHEAIMKSANSIKTHPDQFDFKSIAQPNNVVRLSDYRKPDDTTITARNILRNLEGRTV